MPASDAGSEVVGCNHCQVLGDAGPDAALLLGVYEGPTTEAGPQILSEPGQYVSAEIVFRQVCRPGCSTALPSAVVPTNHATDLLHEATV